MIEPDRGAILADLTFFTARWGELDAPARLELRVVGEGVQPQSGFFAPDDLDAAADWAVGMNVLRRNVYMVRNPLRGDIAAPATDDDVIAAFYCWADCDDGQSVANIRSYGGPGHSATVLTGRVPSLRAHTYWELEEPCLNLAAWRDLQKGIAQRFDSDGAVINPARIMRLAGTVSFPSKKKAAKGYEVELVGMRTEFDDDRDAIDFQALLSEFPVTDKPLAAKDTDKRDGAAMNRAMATAEIRAGNNWHDNVVRLVASYVARGLSDDEIHAITDGFTTYGYTVADTQKEVQTAIDGARRKIGNGQWASREPRQRGGKRSARASGSHPDAGQPPCDPAGRSGENDPPLTPAELTDLAVGDCVGLPLNDYGNGQRIKRHFGEDMLFVPRMSWFTWTGARWEPDEDEMYVRRLAHKLGGLINLEALKIPVSEANQEILDFADGTADELKELRGLKAKGKGKLDAERDARLTLLADMSVKAEEIKALVANQRKTRRTHAKNAGNDGPVKHMLTAAQPYLFRQINDLNADPLLINTENCTLRLSYKPKGAEPGDDAAALVEQLPHDRANMISKVVRANYDANAKCHVFRRFLVTILPDADKRDFIQRWFGYSLTGLTGEQKLVFLHGGGRNGKSTLVDAIAKIAGDYATSLPIETLTGSDQRSGADATPDLVRLPGARIVRASEPEEGTKFKEAMIKLITGGEPIMIRRMREEFTEVEPIFKLTISGNHKPNVRGTDDGIWRRLLLVPFDQQIPKDQVDKTLPEKLWAERDGILAWLIEGALMYLENGLDEPESVIAATAEFREESDPVRQFLDACCILTGSDDDFVTAKDASDAFNMYQQSNNGTTFKPTTFGKRMKEKCGTYRDKTGRTFDVRKVSTIRYVGIRLTDEYIQKLDEVEAKAKQSGRF